MPALLGVAVQLAVAGVVKSSLPPRSRPSLEIPCLVPDDRAERQRVAAYGLALREGRVLLARSSPLSASPGRWWLPGGGVEFGEHPTECLIREFREETGLNVQVTSLLDVDSDVVDLPERRERLHTFRIVYTVAVVDGTLTPEADGTTDAVAWHFLNDALGLQLMPFVRRLLTDE